MKIDLEGLGFIGEVKAPRNVYRVYEKDDFYVIESGNPRDPWERSIQIFSKDEIATVYKCLLGEKMEVKDAKNRVKDIEGFEGLYGHKLYFRTLRALYVLVALRKADMKKEGKAIVFNVYV